MSLSANSSEASACQTLRGANASLPRQGLDLLGIAFRADPVAVLAGLRFTL